MTANIQLSTKTADGRIFVVGGENYGEFYDNLIALYGNPESAERIIEDFAVLLDPPSAPASQPAQPQASASANAAAPGAPTCAHGARTFRSGTGKKGPWTAWFCPEPKGSVQCEAIWG